MHRSAFVYLLAYLEQAVGRMRNLGQIRCATTPSGQKNRMPCGCPGAVPCAMIRQTRMRARDRPMRPLEHAQLRGSRRCVRNGISGFGVRLRCEKPSDLKDSPRAIFIEALPASVTDRALRNIWFRLMMSTSELEQLSRDPATRIGRCGSGAHWLGTSMSEQSFAETVSRA